MPGATAPSPGLTSDGTPCVTSGGTPCVTSDGTPCVTSGGTPCVTSRGTSRVTSRGTSRVTSRITPRVTPEVWELGRIDLGLDDVARWFGIADGRGLTDTFPDVFDPGGRGRRFGVVDGHRLLSHAAAVAVELHDSSRALLVGSVASARSARGHGLASAVIDYVIERARDEGNDSVILWSELHGFFGRFGFVPAGSQYCLPVRARPHSWPPGTRVRPASPADLPKLLELHRHKPLAVRRTPDDLATLLAARPMTTSVLTRGGDLVAYACLGKGADFTGWWHELGGHDLDALRLIEAVTHAIGMPSAMVLVPPYRTDLRQALDPRAAPQPAALRLALTPRGAGALFVDGLDSI